MSADPLKTDPLLLAQQYLLGELSAPEIEAFEERLAEDAVLAEALADVVLLHGALTGAAPARCRLNLKKQIAASGSSGGERPRQSSSVALPFRSFPVHRARW